MLEKHDQQFNLGRIDSRMPKAIILQAFKRKIVQKDQRIPIMER